MEEWKIQLSEYKLLSANPSKNKSLKKKKNWKKKWKYFEEQKLDEDTEVS